MIALDAEELRMLSYAVTYARSSDHLSTREQDVLSQVMVKVYGEVVREGPHFIVGGSGNGQAKMTPEEARKIRMDRLTRVKKNRINKINYDNKSKRDRDEDRSLHTDEPVRRA